jgi:hypothetical protein
MYEVLNPSGDAATQTLFVEQESGNTNRLTFIKKSRGNDYQGQWHDNHSP